MQTKQAAKTELAGLLQQRPSLSLKFNNQFTRNIVITTPLLALAEAHRLAFLVVEVELVSQAAVVLLES